MSKVITFDEKDTKNNVNTNLSDQITTTSLAKPATEVINKTELNPAKSAQKVFKSAQKVFNVPDTVSEVNTKGSELDKLIDDYLAEYQALGDFEYDANNNLAQYYDRTYRNAALLARENALGQGGTGYSSAKQALANSAYNSTIGELGDVQQQLYQLALDEYQQKRADALENIELARTLKNDATADAYQNWYMNFTENESAREQSNIDREYEANRSDVQWEQKFTESEAEREQSNIDKEYSYKTAALAAQYGVYTGLAELTGMDFSSVEDVAAFDYAYNVYLATGDKSYFEKLGIDTSKITEDALKESAILKAEYGDYSGLEAMGIDTSSLTEDRMIDIALAAAQYGNYDMLEEVLGVDLSDYKYAEQLETGLAAAAAGDYKVLESIGFDTTFIRKLNAASLSTASSSSSSSGGSGKKTTVKTITDDIIEGAEAAYKYGDENLDYYLQSLEAKGYTEEQCNYIIGLIVEEQEVNNDSTPKKNNNKDNKSDSKVAEKYSPLLFSDTYESYFDDHLKNKIK